MLLNLITYLCTWSMLLSLIKKSPLSSWFSCYSTTNVIAAGQHGKTELPDEDFAGVFWGVNSARHQLRLLQIPTPSWSSSMDHPNCHWVSENTGKDGPILWNVVFSPSWAKNLIKALLMIWFTSCHILISPTTLWIWQIHSHHFLNPTSNPASFCPSTCLWSTTLIGRTISPSPHWR